MSSIKLEVLSQIAKRKQCNRQDVQKFIWVAQGNDIKDYVNRQGYYGTNIVSWKYDGLIDNDTKNVFKITKKGKEYIKNPNAYNKAVRMKRKVETENTRGNTLRMEYQEYSKLSEELSILIEYKHKNGTNTEIENRLKQIVKKIMPFAF